MAIKGFGIALKLTLGGSNQFTHPSTYVFAIVVIVCILTQMNYFNKALATYNTNMYDLYLAMHCLRLLTSASVNPLYYVTFTTCTLTASFIMFSGFNTSDATNTISLLCGFLTIFTGVYLLNLSREDPDGINAGIKSARDGRGVYHDVDGIPTDGLAGLQTRLSMQSRRSGEGHRRSNSWSLRSPNTGRSVRTSADYGAAHATRGEHQHMLHSYDIEANTLGDLAEDSDEDTTSGSNHKRTSFDNGRPNGESNGGLFNAPRKAATENVHLGSGKGFDPKR